jgi:hypothetical protein
MIIVVTMCLSLVVGHADQNGGPQLAVKTIDSEVHPAVIAPERGLAIRRPRVLPEYDPPFTSTTLSGVFAMTDHGCEGPRCFENTAQVIAPGINPACPSGQIVLSKGQDNIRLKRGLEDRTVWLRNLNDPTGGFDTGAVPVEVSLPDTAETVSRTDNLLLKLADDSLLMIRQGKVWEPVSPKPEWWDHVTIGGRPKGTRGAQLVFRSTDCGQTWTLISMIDPARLPNKKYAIPRPESGSAKALWNQSQSDLEDSVASRGWEKYQLTTLEAFVPEGGQDARFNVTATKTGWLKIDKFRQWAAGWARTDFIRNNEALGREGYRLVRLNAYVLPIADGERFNAVWEQTTEDRPWVAGWTRDDFDRKNQELRQQGFRLIELNSYMHPVPDGERFNAIWEKSTDDRLEVFGWTGTDLERRHSELKSRGYQLKIVNTNVLPIPNGERFNAVWEKTNENRQTVWGWARNDLERFHRRLQAQGFELIDLNAYVLPGGQGERYNAIWTDYDRGGHLGGWDRPDAYVDPWNGKIFISMYGVGGSKIDYTTWDKIGPGASGNFVFVSEDGARSWNLLTEPNAWTPMVMTTTPNGRVLIFTVRGAPSVPELHYSLLGSGPNYVFKTAEAYYSEVRNGVHEKLQPAVNPLYSKFVYKATNSISRISTDAGSSKVRLSYSFMENGQTGVAVVMVEISDDSSPPKITPLAKFYASDPSRSILASTFVEPDIAAARDGENTSLFYWVEGAERDFDAYSRFSVFRGEATGTDPADLGGPWNPMLSVGHYMYSGSFRSPDGRMSYLAHWVQPNAVTANIVSVPRMPTLVDPQ